MTDPSAGTSGRGADEGGAVNARIVYWGADGAGKRTNLRVIHAKLRPDHRGDLRLVPTRLDPTVSYAVLPIELGEVGGVRTRIQIVAVPGERDQAPTRKQLLDRIDGVVFVADARREHLAANLASFEELRSALAAYGRPLEQMPLVIQYNKRDLADPFAMEELHRKLSMRGVAAFEAVAKDGTAVLQTLTTISKRVIRHLRERANEESASQAKTVTSLRQAPGAPAQAPPRTAPPPGVTQLIDRAELSATLGKSASRQAAPPLGTTQLVERMVAPEAARPMAPLAAAAKPNVDAFADTVAAANSLFEASFESAKRTVAAPGAAAKAPAVTPPAKSAHAGLDIESEADSLTLALELAGAPEPTPDGLRIPLWLRDGSGKRRRLTLALRLEDEDT